MNFDVVIIGGGLAGLTCGIALQEQGKRCVIINNGQAALDFASGSMDLLGRLPDGSAVSSLRPAFESLRRQAPQHPYSVLGIEAVESKATQFENILHQLNLELAGSARENHKRVTAIGGLRPAWLSPNTVPTVTNHQNFIHQRIAVLGIEGYHDFQPQLLIDNLQLNPQFAHCQFSSGFLNIPELDQLRRDAREFRSVNIAQLLEHKLSFDELAAEIKQAAGDAEAVFLPACFGLDDQSLFNGLKQATGLALYELPTLPPSLLGIRQHKQLSYRFEKLGGMMLNGDRALRAEFEGDKVACVYTRLHQEEPIAAENFVLAAGGFFSNGLSAEFERIREPVFDADIIETEQFRAQDRFSWTHKRFSSPQPYQAAGVIINAHCQVQKSGRFLPNLYAAGSVIGGYNAIELGCGAGVAVVTALIAAERIGGM
ncbi:glycerol 3-phosphate dehydrogenase (quinone) subunit B [Mesocricetibacter intestinalis]|uniref:Anaerobic glycerol-3-phosphate dehydrogenase subunit B n=1 Tax=Mesocricetibacter intestinalis TaxID=1521930 RepID=A0A4R6VAT8_9PAST|nr:glycerol-3-phosphate dehydrogenase subunit GlpB [Mesocricetibacter intestinalis]TDQ56495.1 glycerol 3-phosphate dehydrogenase (quinone) subunit B [Mesocricetibacter intestinalis]